MSTQSQSDASLPDNDDFHKSVQFDKADGTEQVAYGAVLVPDRVDHQGDFFRADTIKGLAKDFDERAETKDAVPGVMHAVFPEHIELAENRITEEEIELGEKTLPAGSWIQGWKFKDDELWELVDDGVLAGYSIGGTVDGRVMYEAGTHPEDVSFPSEVTERFDDETDKSDVPIWEIKGGRIMEVSTVDMPAVPDATHEAYKSLTKGAPQLTSSVVDARLYLEERGHSEEDAKRLAEYLISQKSQEPSGWIERAKRFFSGGGGDDGTTPETPDTEKAGRTLSSENVESAMAVHDAALDLLNRSDVSHGRVRFSDDASHSFDIGEYGAASKSDELAESSDGPTDVFETMDKDELKDLIGEVVDEKMNEQEETTDEKTDDEPSDLDEIKSLLKDLNEDEEEEAEKSEESDDLAEIKELLGAMAKAQGVSQQAETQNGNGAEKTWDNSPFGVGGGR